MGDRLWYTVLVFNQATQANSTWLSLTVARRQLRIECVARESDI